MTRTKRMTRLVALAALIVLVVHCGVPCFYVAALACLSDQAGASRGCDYVSGVLTWINVLSSIPDRWSSEPEPPYRLPPASRPVRPSAVPTYAAVDGAYPATAATVSTRTAGATLRSAIDKMEMVYVPAGTFRMGADGNDRAASRVEFPQHEVYLDAYWIDRTEVTNAQYAAFATATGRWFFLTTASGGPADRPVGDVTWADADAYCRWAGRSLPTEAQWEMAARGTDGRRYPWGNEAPTASGDGYPFDSGTPAGQRCNCGPDAYNATPVGQYPAGASPYGALDMAGNLNEWVADWFGPYAEAPQRNPSGPETGSYRVHRGGDFIDSWMEVRSTHRQSLEPGKRPSRVGFRCALR